MLISKYNLKTSLPILSRCLTASHCALGKASDLRAPRRAPLSRALLQAQRPSLHAAQMLLLREPSRKSPQAWQHPPCDHLHSRGFTMRSRPGRGAVSGALTRPGWDRAGRSHRDLQHPWVSHQLIQSPLMGNSIFAFPEAVSQQRGKCWLASAVG